MPLGRWNSCPPQRSRRAGVSSGNSIAVSGNTVYVAGEYKNGLKNIACFWVDNSRTDLPVTPAAGSSSGSSIAVLDGKIYMAGNYDGEACYWVDGVRTDLAVPTGASVAYGNSIAVVKIVSFYNWPTLYVKYLP